MKVGFSVFGFALDCIKNKELKWSKIKLPRQKEEEKSKRAVKKKNGKLQRSF